MDQRTEELICKVCDGVATAEEKRELKTMTARNPDLQEEIDRQQEAIASVRSVGLRELQDDVADRFAAGVYNRLEQRAAWIMVLVGVALVAGYGLYEILTEPDIHTVYRLGIAALIVGFGLLLSHAVRVRRRLRRGDRYEEVIR